MGEKAALGFGPDRIRTLVSMATDSSHRVIMGKTASPRTNYVDISDHFIIRILTSMEVQMFFVLIRIHVSNLRKNVSIIIMRLILL